MLRYRQILDDYDAFAAACARPEPTTIRVRTGRVTPERLRERLEAQGFELEAVPGLPFFRVLEAPFAVSQTLEHWLGLCYVQQLSTGLAALALEARPGERVLDMSAAPGGKTSHIAERMDDRGCIVASDRSDKRQRALMANVYRMAHPSVLAVTVDGRDFPLGATFDRVLVDAPCSGEGNVRRSKARGPRKPLSFRRHIVGVQEALLRRAIALTAPGGTILYSTCTFAPEENERVLDAVLADAPVALEPIPLELPHVPGVTRFKDQRYADVLVDAWRIYPHHYDSGGLFMARLRKHGEARGRDEGWTPVPAVFPGDVATGRDAAARIAAGVHTLRETFGLDDAALEGLGWIVRGDAVWMHSCDAWPVAGWPEGVPRLLSLGIRALGAGPDGRDRATNDLLRWLDRRLRARVVTLSAAECAALLEAGSLPVDLTDGWAAIRLEERVIGRGVVRRGALRPEIPKAHLRALRRVVARV